MLTLPKHVSRTIHRNDSYVQVLKELRQRAQTVLTKNCFSLQPFLLFCSPRHECKHQDCGGVNMTLSQSRLRHKQLVTPSGAGCDRNKAPKTVLQLAATNSSGLNLCGSL
ncbi:uncharacterized protein [Physcomitrium patens]|uniref:Uncharacterized protein n=1 Tax=Physcomitrium patens TaxID=3218 RepID=A0A2K1JJD1_PHYPA|nr:uncharacterized protein LOC112291767 [Physcomitrium patens]PNR41629.1 hypothetical protein PHYPA_019034 [Physcomitrium patens]|eukprot:XP_024395400.1 uncharacterized protein LOC112291767 [Physcomitrella patens]